MTHQQCCVQKFQLGPLGPVGPIANSNCFEKRSSLEPVGGDLWLTFQDSSLFRLAIGRPSCAPDTLYCPLFILFDPSALSAFCQKQSLSMNQLLAWLTLHLTFIKYFIPTEKENPYEDVDLKRKSLGRKSCLLESNRSWTTMDKKLNSPPQVSHMTLHCFPVLTYVNPLAAYQC